MKWLVATGHTPVATFASVHPHVRHLQQSSSSHAMSRVIEPVPLFKTQFNTMLVTLQNSTSANINVLTRCTCICASGRAMINVSVPKFYGFLLKINLQKIYANLKSFLKRTKITEYHSSLHVVDSTVARNVFRRCLFVSLLS
jgi:hypothetical protein